MISRFNSHLQVTTFLTLCISLWLCVTAHSSLTLPEPYTRKLCKEPSCRACPEFPSPQGLMPNNVDRPEVTWQRGQEVEVKWAKNNHNGGFVRLGIVPVDKMFDFDAHERFAIYYGCWEQGLQRCEKRSDSCQVNCREFDCAADNNNRVYSRKMIVPKVIPDGVYVLAYIWYGGIAFTRDFGKFSDYESCSFIEIKGGPFESSYQAFYEAGENKLFPKTPAGQCLTSATSPIECKTGCDNVRVFNDIPEPFRSGEKPAPLLRDAYDGSVTHTAEPSRTSTPSPKITTSATPAVATPFTIPSLATASPSADKVCRRNICCPLECGRDCGTRACWMNAAGPQNCCVGPIKFSRRKCGRDAPPCRMSKK